MTAIASCLRCRESGIAVCRSLAGWIRRQTTHPHRVARLVMLYTLSGVHPVSTQASKPTDYQVKAAYLSYFGRFVEFPPGSAPARDEPFSICVLGDDPFGPVLDSALAGEVINGTPLVPKRIARPQEAARCRILFVSESEDSALKELLAALDGANVLTVSDLPQFVKRGGMIQFVLDGNRVRFEVNLAAAQRAGLNLSSQLVKLAVAVRRSP